jgi:hypothetical protein
LRAAEKWLFKQGYTEAGDIVKRWITEDWYHPCDPLITRRKPQGNPGSRWEKFSGEQATKPPAKGDFVFWIQEPPWFPRFVES